MEPPRSQGKLDNLVNPATIERFRDALANLPEAGRSPEPDDPFEEIDTRDFAQACHRSMAEGSSTG